MSSIDGKVLRIACVGLSNADESLVRGYFRMLSAEHGLSLEWVTGQDPSKQLLIVSHLFMDSPQINKLLQAGHVRVLWVRRDPTKPFEVVKENQQYSISVPIQSTSDLYQYLRVASGIVPGQNQAPKDDKILENLQALWQKGGQGQLTANGQPLAWVDSTNHRVWPLNANISRQISHATFDVRAIPQPLAEVSMPMSVWLWDLAWRLGGEDGREAAALEQRWTLDRWPQPAAPMPISDILRICGYLHVKNSSLQDLLAIGDIDRATINQTLHALQLLGYARSATSADNTAAQVKLNNRNAGLPPEVQQGQGFKGMLGRLRSKLGL